jgi:hypothetical protein
MAPPLDPEVDMAASGGTGRTIFVMEWPALGRNPPFVSRSSSGRDTRVRTMCEEALRQVRLFQLERWRMVFAPNSSSRAMQFMNSLELLGTDPKLYG